ncbi:hypothetical protein QQF64_000025 [Cirrhinus molitorella]|uniref:Uncharacterized protein n=1 Tax=Cirrhinus molitorella TaxID=172907 RepID=A0ABR3NW10_9TELE
MLDMKFQPDLEDEGPLPSSERWQVQRVGFSPSFRSSEQNKEVAGFKLNNRLNQILVARYAENEVIDFDNFVCCLIKLEAMFRSFQQLDKDGTGTAEMNISGLLA